MVQSHWQTPNSYVGTMLRLQFTPHFVTLFYRKLTRLLLKYSEHVQDLLVSLRY